MEKKSIYIVHDPSAEDLIYYNDLDGFRELVEDGARIDHAEFETEQEVEAYVSALYLGIDERTPAGFAVLQSTVDTDLPYIEIIKEQ